MAQIPYDEHVHWDRMAEEQLKEMERIRKRMEDATSSMSGPTLAHTTGTWPPLAPTTGPTIFPPPPSASRTLEGDIKNLDLAQHLRTGEVFLYDQNNQVAYNMRGHEIGIIPMEQMTQLAPLREALVYLEKAYVKRFEDEKS